MGPLRLLDKRAMRKLSRQYLDEIKVHVPSVDAEAERLSGGQRQAVAVARAVRAAHEDPAARRAARGHGRARVAPHHRSRQGSGLDRPGVDHRDRPQLRPSLRALRPHQRHAGRPHHHRPAGARDVARGADRADGLELSPAAGRGFARRRPDPRARQRRDEGARPPRGLARRRQPGAVRAGDARQVDEHAREVAAGLDAQADIPVRVVCRQVATSPESIRRIAPRGQRC